MKAVGQQDLELEAQPHLLPPLRHLKENASRHLEPEEVSIFFNLFIYFFLKKICVTTLTLRELARGGDNLNKLFECKGKLAK